MPKKSARDKIADLFLSKIGTVLSSDEIRKVAAISSWARRVRELREQMGWKILTHHDRENLKPGQYLLESAPPLTNDVVFKRTISARIRAQVLDRNGFTCQMCGLSPGDVDPYTNRKVRLHVGHIKDKSLGGRDELNNLRALCSTCNQGAKNRTGEKPEKIWLLTQVRRAGLDEQRAVYEWLQAKFTE
jgi:5-methylcytosine-specific restriction endonuclease McrA